MSLLTSHVLLVNEKDEPLGTMEKMEAHRRGLLHRAFSVFIFNDQGEMLLQRRSLKKYHSGGLWTNACCSHPYPDEDILQAAKRRTTEELGIDIELKKVFVFTYNASLDNGLIEHEFDHVFIGTYNGSLQPNQEEVGDYAYLDMNYLSSHIENHPSMYTAWFTIAFPILQEHMLKAAQ
ncbi:MAG: isopentenyl-diphosphate Delta-isomerase [Bacteroidota bacterium]